MTNCRLALLPLLLIWVLSGLAGCDRPTSDPAAGSENGSSVAVDDKVYLNIAFGELRDPIEFASAWSGSTTVLDLLLEAAEKNAFQVDYQGSGATAFVNGIAGIRGGADRQGWWIFRVNGKLIHQGSGVQQLQRGDRVLWQLGEYQQ